MGILTTLLTLPVSGSLNGVNWIAGKIHESAIEGFYDPSAIEAELMALEERLEAGEITEEEFEELEVVLLDRLKEGRRLRGVAGPGIAAGGSDGG